MGDPVGASEGTEVCPVGDNVSENAVGPRVGPGDGGALGALEGLCTGDSEGVTLGELVGAREGASTGESEGANEGESLGACDGNDGAFDGNTDGLWEGASEGIVGSSVGDQVSSMSPRHILSATIRALSGSYKSGVKNSQVNTWLSMVAAASSKRHSKKGPMGATAPLNKFTIKSSLYFLMSAAIARHSVSFQDVKRSSG